MISSICKQITLALNANLEVLYSKLYEKIEDNLSGISKEEFTKTAKEIFAGLEFASNTPDKKKRAKKDPNAPKKYSGFMVFSEDNREKVKSENPNIEFADISRKLGSMWNSLSDKEKEEYNEKAKTWIRPEKPVKEKKAKSVKTSKSDSESDSAKHGASAKEQKQSDESDKKEKKVQKSSKSDKQEKVEKKEAVKKVKKSDSAKAQKRSDKTYNKFDYSSVQPISITKESEFWKLSPVKLGGIIYRIHKATGIVLEKTEDVLVGIYKDQQIIKENDLPSYVLDFCIDSDIKLDTGDDSETEAEMDAEDELDE